MWGELEDPRLLDLERLLGGSLVCHEDVETPPRDEGAGSRLSFLVSDSVCVVWASWDVDWACVGPEEEEACSCG